MYTYNPIYFYILVQYIFFTHLKHQYNNKVNHWANKKTYLSYYLKINNAQDFIILLLSLDILVLSNIRLFPFIHKTIFYKRLLLSYYLLFF